MTFEPIIALYAAILGLLAAYLTMRVILTRVRTGIESGDGGSEDMMRVLRAHGNFVEQAPMALILVAAGEAAGARDIVVHVLGIALVVARVASAIALNRTIRQTNLRRFSGGLSDLILIASSVVILLALVGVR
jgi:uncharacterized membrane protein YecN with MAPEG domain